jgi:hypothetical protein
VSPQVVAALIAGGVSAVGVAAQALLAVRSQKAAKSLLNAQAKLARQAEASASIRSMAISAERVRIATRALAASASEESTFKDVVEEWSQASRVFVGEWARVRIDVSELHPAELEILRAARHAIHAELDDIRSRVRLVHDDRSPETIKDLQDVAARALSSLDDYVSRLSALGRLAPE